MQSPLRKSYYSRLKEHAAKSSHEQARTMNYTMYAIVYILLCIPTQKCSSHNEQTVATKARSSKTILPKMHHKRADACTVATVAVATGVTGCHWMSGVPLHTLLTAHLTVKLKRPKPHSHLCYYYPAQHNSLHLPFSAVSCTQHPLSPASCCVNS